MPVIYLYGSFDRFNYGDILFPLILKQYIVSDSQFSNNYKIRFISPFKGDETKRGGLKTKPIKAVFNNFKKEDSLIIVGGDILTASWLQLYLQRHGNDLKFRILHKILSFISRTPNNLMNNYIRYFYGVKHLEKPYAIKNTKKQFKLIYNSVGGASLSGEIAKKHYKEAIFNADLFSVRDSFTKMNLPNQQAITVSPDIAILTKEMISLQESNIKMEEHEFFVFQIGKNFITKDRIEQIATQLNSITNKTGLFVILLPIGTAYGHQDHLALKTISRHLRPNSFHLIENTRISDIIKIIANAKFFIGTSLHGAITSMSFENPHFYLNIHIKKLSAYLKTWQIETFSNPLEISNFSETIIEYLQKNFENNKYNNHIKGQKELAMNQLKAISQIIFSK
ncbi:MAG: polysaccharide pyruvyl transferase family protein [Candidatus Woesearchaeota archaeon]